MSNQERYTSLSFSLLLRGEGFADDRALPRWLSLPSRRGRTRHRRLSEGVRARIVQFARTRYAGFDDNYLCEKLGDVAAFRRSSLRSAEYYNQSMSG
jgi:hypothetical protein